MDGWMDGWMEGWMDGWMDGCFCFVLFCEKRFGQGRTGPLPEITHLLFGGALPLPLYYPCPRKFSRLLELVLPKKTKQPATGLYRQVPFPVFLMSFWKMLFLLWIDCCTCFCVILTLLSPAYPLHRTRTAPFAHVMSLLLHFFSGAFVPGPAALRQRSVQRGSVCLRCYNVPLPHGGSVVCCPCSGMPCCTMAASGIWST